MKHIGSKFGIQTNKVIMYTNIRFRGASTTGPSSHIIYIIDIYMIFDIIIIYMLAIKKNKKKKKNNIFILLYYYIIILLYYYYYHIIIISHIDEPA